ncbi:SGNH/GDSL hydrolase family protein (plasmid) [Vibrio alginolyticus]|uniref:SGNH/GDSL hydrolase family protein n=1 Tax=Vibrio alginolyticus TaxID=663 RepID=UPI0038CD2019
MTQNIEQRTEAAVSKYEVAASKIEEFSEKDSIVSTSSGDRKSFPMLSREIEEAALESFRLGAGHDQGIYSVGVTYDKPNWTYTYNGQKWGLSSNFDLSMLPYKATLDDPNADDNLSVYGNASTGYVNKAQGEVVDGDIYPEFGVLVTGDKVPVGKTHLRVSVGGRPQIVAMSPAAAGIVSLLTESSATIGAVKCKLIPWHLTFKAVNALSEIQQRMTNGEQLIFKAFGDSLTYGFDLTGSGNPINGSTDARAATPYPESLADSLGAFYGVKPIILNRGYPGDTSKSWKERWGSYESSDVTLIMYGTNDALSDGDGNPKVSVAEYKSHLRDLIVREKINGTPCVVLLQSPELLNSNDNISAVQFRARNLHSYRKATQELGDEFGLPVVRTSEFVSWMGSFAYSDNTHYNRYGYNEIGFNLAALFMPNGEGIKYAVGDMITPLNSQARGYLTTQAESRYKLNGSNVAFSLLSGSRDLYIYGYFNEDCYIAIQTINSLSTSMYSLSARVSGGDRSGVISNTTMVSNDGSSLSKRKISALKIRKGYRVILIDTTSVSSIECISITDSAIDDSSNSYIFRNSGLFFKPASTLMQTITSDSTLELGGSVLIDIDLPTTGGGLILQARPDFDGVPSRYVWITRLNETSLYIRKYIGSEPDDSIIDNVFTTGVDNYQIELIWVVSTDEVIILVDNVEVASIVSASLVLLDGYSKVGAISSNNTDKIVINQILSVI